MKVDILIIGSGVAASSLSSRLLSANPKASILILEASQKVKMQDSALWEDYLLSNKLPYDKYKDEAYPERDQAGENLSIGTTEVPLQGSRVMTYGGSTIHWGGWSFRLKPEDFQLKTNTGEGIDWPIDYNDLEPYYCQAEHYIGVSADSNDPTVPRTEDYPFPAFPYSLEDQPVIQAMESLNIDYSTLPIARHGITETTSKHAPCKTTGTCKYCPFGARYAATNFLNDMTEWGNFPNFKTQINCIVQEIMMDSKNKAKGVVYLDKTSNESHTIEADQIIVAAGAIESPKLLLRSRSEYWVEGIGNDHDLVGRNFITHPYFMFKGTIAENPLKLQPEMNFPTLCSRYFDSPEEQKKGKFIFVNPPSSPSVGLASLMQAGNSREVIEQSVIGKNNIQLDGMVEIFSKFNNRVMNFDKKNHIGLEETIVDYSKDAGFDQRMDEIKSHVEAIFDKMGATLLPKFTVSWRADHAACTCRMSDNKEEGVTDKNMKVHGVDNLYVCSNAAFSSLGTVNPTLTLTALSLRLADYLIVKGAQ